MTTSRLNQPFTALLAATLLALAPAHAGAQQRLQDGERMIARCLDLAASQKYPPMSVGVIDASGTLIAFKRQDGAAPATAEAALLKARTAARLHAPTSLLAEVAAADAPTRDAFLIMQMTTLPGGVPIVDKGGQVIGAVGVSGGEASQDAACAQKAIDPSPVGKKN